MDNKEKEIWKDIPGWEGLYQISSLGRCKSLERTFSHSKGKNGLMTRRERLLKPSKDSKGYFVHGFRCKERRSPEFKKVHQFVAMAFLNHKPNGSNKLTVDHIDNNKENNRLSNLQIITNRENASKDRYRHGYSSKYVGVIWDKNRNLWRAEITINNKGKHLGRFKNELDASDAYQDALKKHLAKWH